MSQSDKSVKIKVLFIIFYSWAVLVNGQQFDQVIEFNKLVNYTILSDAQGDIYLCGYDKDHTQGGLWWNDTGLTIYSIRKYDPATKAILWEKFLYSNNSLQIHSVKMRQSGILLAGFFKDTVCIDGNCQLSKGQSDVFIAAVDVNGKITVNWQGGLGAETVYGLDLDHQNNVYMAGTLSGSAQIGNASYNAGSKTAFYLLKMDSTLKPIWRKIGTDPGTGNGVANGLVLQVHNSLLYFLANGRTTFEFTTDTFGCGSVCGTLPEFDLNGNFIRETHPFGSYYYHGAGICFKDLADDFYFTEYGITHHGPDHFAFGKLDKQLQPKWEFKPACKFLDYHSIIKVDGEFLLGGPISGAADSSGYAIVRGDLQTGTANHYSLIPTPTGSLHRTQLQPYLKGGLIFSGNTFSTVVLGTHTLTNGTSDNADGFIAIMKPDLVGLNNHNRSAKISLFPNPTTGKVTIQSDSPGNVYIYDLQGTQVLNIVVNESTTEIDLGLPPGVYIGEFENTKNQTRVVKVVVN